MNNSRLPIRDLVETRLKGLGIRPGTLARRCGYKNLAKGIRRIEAMSCGDLDAPSTRMMLKALPVALEVDEGVVEAAVHETVTAIEHSARTAAAERDAAFKPHAYLVGSETRPSSITVFDSAADPNGG